MKRTLVAGVAALSLVVLAGCGSSGKTGATTEPSTVATTAPSHSEARSYATPSALVGALEENGLRCQNFNDIDVTGGTQTASCQIPMAPEASEPLEYYLVTISVSDDSQELRSKELFAEIRQVPAVSGKNWLVDCGLGGATSARVCELVQRAIGGDLNNAALSLVSPPTEAPSTTKDRSAADKPQEFSDAVQQSGFSTIDANAYAQAVCVEFDRGETSAAIQQYVQDRLDASHANQSGASAAHSLTKIIVTYYCSEYAGRVS
ncbi:hypothetical protein [Gordonia jacobaea]|uniref:hypothetical protein n=1 Tax=Gordonia jacobaea TaxID=122202 RepID=UPI0022E4EC5A|nr:hypothetical protein [Gordonia jacobaea]